MSRPSGARNRDYPVERDALAARIALRLVAPGGAAASFRELAAAADCSPATLRHYFGDRDGAYAAAFEVLERQGAPWLSLAADAGDGDAERSLGEFLRLFVVGWRRGVGPIQAAALAAGLQHPGVGGPYLDHVLEPVQQALEARVGALMDRGELDPGDRRLAALELLAPVLLALLHQHALSGDRCRPLDVDRFVDGHLSRFLRAWRPR